jgi:hypothetical protein
MRLLVQKAGPQPRSVSLLLSVRAGALHCQQDLSTIQYLCTIGTRVVQREALLALEHEVAAYGLRRLLWQ